MYHMFLNLYNTKICENTISSSLCKPKTVSVDLGSGAGFRLLENGVVRRRTVNKKEGVDAARLFLQTKLVKPAADEASRNIDAEDVSWQWNILIFAECVFFFVYFVKYTYLEIVLF